MSIGRQPQPKKILEGKKETRFINLDLRRQIKLEAVEEFAVDEFYRQLADSGVKLRMSPDFLSLIVDPVRDTHIALSPSRLNRDVLKARAYDSEIATDFEGRSTIPLMALLAQLKKLLEAQPNGEPKEDGLDVKDGNTNIFHVDLGEGKGILSVRLRLGREDENRTGQEQHDGEWLILAVPLSDERKKHPRTPGCVFFSPGN